MVADALEILGDHQQVQGVLPVAGVGGDAGDQGLLHLAEIGVHGVIGSQNGLCFYCIMFYECVNTFCHHRDGCPGHLAENVVMLGGAALQEGDDLGDVLGLVADALHVGDHFQGGGDLAQVPGHRLLLQKQLQAQRLDGALLLVDLRVQGAHLGGQGGVSLRQGLGGQGDDLLAQGAHLDELPVQQRQLLVKLSSHYPNLPVM